MNQAAYFITGTDTNIGKTYAAHWLLRHFKAKGFSTIGLKPLSSGARKVGNELQNDDALILQETATIKLPLSIVNPFVFEKPVAPHIAANDENITLTSTCIASSILNTMANYVADRYVIEGAGGLLVPINAQETMLDVIRLLNFPVILVVGIKLGCINHALLTAQVFEQHGIKCEGWIANCLDPDCLDSEKIIETLNEFLTYPCLQMLPFN